MDPALLTNEIALVGQVRGEATESKGGIERRRVSAGRRTGVLATHNQSHATQMPNVFSGSVAYNIGYSMGKDTDFNSPEVMVRISDTRLSRH